MSIENNDVNNNAAKLQSTPFKTSIFFTYLL